MSCFSDLCRLCAGKIDGLLSFNVLAPDHQELLKKILICLPIHVSEKDNYPKYICMDCTYKLDLVFEFRERCLLTAQLFEEMIMTDDVQNVLHLPVVVSDSNDLPYSEQTDHVKATLEMESLQFEADDYLIESNENEPCHDILPTASNVKVEEILEIPNDVIHNSVSCSEQPILQELASPTIENKIKIEKNGTRKQKCSECGKICTSNYKLLEHMRRHTGEKPFNCTDVNCSKSFRSKIGLAQHQASHSGEFKLSCPVCGKGFQCKSYLTVHQRVHSTEKPFTCQQCPQTFKSKQSLTDHVHRHLGVKPYLCDICGRGFITKGLCKSHQKTHTGQDNRQYPCHVCCKLFVSKSYLRTHFNIHTGEKPYMCEVCGKAFLTRVDLRIHSTMHTGEKSFVCETCGKAFARKDALRCHKRSHTGERPYKCNFCGQSFSQFSPMAIHKRLHTGERPYSCADCPKAFVSRSTLSTHRKKHHDT